MLKTCTRSLIVVSIAFISFSCGSGDKYLPSSNPPEYDPKKTTHRRGHRFRSLPQSLPDLLFRKNHPLRCRRSNLALMRRVSGARYR